MNDEYTLLLGHPASYWIELDRRMKLEKGLEASELLEEVVKLRGQLDFVRKRVNEVYKLLKVD